ncbi:MAG: trypsin-like peptidase domain-containing protein, partial [Cyclobacteriaceae bacterium]
MMTNDVIGQDRYYPNWINHSPPNSKNINHPDGTELQDVKRASGWLLRIRSTEPETLGGECSCVLVNNARQDKTPYVMTAAHCIPESTLIGDKVDAYMSFDYEMSSATERGNPVANQKISGIWKVQYELSSFDVTSDIALLRLVDPNPDLLRHAYAVGWSNTTYKSVSSHISHPGADHKKVYINPLSSKLVFTSGFVNLKEEERILYHEGLFYENDPNWNGVAVSPKGGSSGGGYFSEEDLLIAIHSILEPTNVSFGSALLNSWYAPLSSTEEPGLSTFLDHFSHDLNSVPGGYREDLIPVETENFELPIPSGSDPLRTPSVDEDDPTLLVSELEIVPSTLFGLVSERERPTGVWQDIVGLKTSSIGDSDLALSVYYQDLNTNTGLYEERLIYGASVNKLTTPNGNGSAFRGDGWDCEDLPEGYPPCNNETSNVFDNSTDDHNAVRTRLFRAMGDISKDQGRIVRAREGVPIVVQLNNIGPDDVTVKALSYPGEMPLNALQLFEPEKVSKAFNSYKYHDSRAYNSANLYIDNLSTFDGMNTPVSIPTGDNGGYLNLVNHNFKISWVAGDLIGIDLDIVSVAPYNYKIWVDYFNTDKLGGRKGFISENNLDNYTYNFVDDPEGHGDELVSHDTNKSDASFVSLFNVPNFRQLKMSPGEKHLTRMRVAVSDEPITQDGKYENGEVEEYLVEIVAPTCETLRPPDYDDEYAQKVLPYCGEGGYRKTKESLASHYQETVPGSLIFETGKQSNIQYATAKAVRKWYASTSDVVLEATTGIDYSVPRFLDNQVPNPAV